jgi:hypothetical protein
VVECAGLEIRFTRKRDVGSNPTLSARTRIVQPRDIGDRPGEGVRSVTREPDALTHHFPNQWTRVQRGGTAMKPAMTVSPLPPMVLTLAGQVCRIKECRMVVSSRFVDLTIEASVPVEWLEPGNIHADLLVERIREAHRVRATERGSALRASPESTAA